MLRDGGSPALAPMLQADIRQSLQELRPHCVLDQLKVRLAMLCSSDTQCESQMRNLQLLMRAGLAQITAGQAGSCMCVGSRCALPVHVSSHIASHLSGRWIRVALAAALLHTSPVTDAVDSAPGAHACWPCCLTGQTACFYLSLSTTA